MGLLVKALSTDFGYRDDPWEEFLAEARTLPLSLDYPSVLFTKLVNFLKISKAALFFKIPEGDGYKLLGAKGYDKTSSNRMRLPLHVMDTDFFRSLEKRKQALKMNKPPLWLKEFCSSREFGLFEELYWLPFVTDGKITALILVSEWEDMEDKRWFSRFQSIQKEFSASIWNSRKALREAPSVPEHKISREYLQNCCREMGASTPYIISMDLNPVIKELNTMQSGLNTRNHKPEIISLFRTMAGQRQRILEMEKNRILLILDRSSIPDSRLFLHQLSSSLPLLYQDLKTAPVLNYREFSLPQNDAEWGELIGALM